jgi:hypothetical protein
MALDAVDADWLVTRSDPLFDMDDPGALQRAWRAYAANSHAGEPSPFDAMPLFRIELELSCGYTPFDLPGPLDFTETRDRGSGMAQLEDAWFEIEVSSNLDNVQLPGWLSALLYHGLFVPPLAVTVRGSLPSAKRGLALSGVFSLAPLPSITSIASYTGSVYAEELAVFDVGQGSAGALLDSSGIPSLFFDLGCGVYRNHGTSPATLGFCFCRTPAAPIVLSHWDADHWAGAYWGAAAAGPFTALTKTWIAPLQTVGPVHVAFAHDIISNGGSVYTYQPAAGSVAAHLITSGHTLKVACGNGTSRNHSRIVLVVESSGVPRESWILTGDCDYAHFAAMMRPATPVVLVAPHHGASLSPGSPVPAAVSGGYCQVIYSYGPNNVHGSSKTQHPTPAGVHAHAAAPWRHGSWPGNPPPGSTVAGPDVLATARHATPGQHLGSIVAGWILPTLRTTSPCGGANCSTLPTQK